MSQGVIDHPFFGFEILTWSNPYLGRVHWCGSHGQNHRPPSPKRIGWPKALGFGEFFSAAVVGKNYKSLETTYLQNRKQHHLANIFMIPPIVSKCLAQFKSVLASSRWCHPQPHGGQTRGAHGHVSLGSPRVSRVGQGSYSLGKGCFQRFLDISLIFLYGERDMFIDFFRFARNLFRWFWSWPAELGPNSITTAAQVRAKYHPFSSDGKQTKDINKNINKATYSNIQ